MAKQQIFRSRLLDFRTAVPATAMALFGYAVVKVGTDSDESSTGEQRARGDDRKRDPTCHPSREYRGRYSTHGNAFTSKERRCLGKGTASTRHGGEFIAQIHCTIPSAYKIVVLALSKFLYLKGRKGKKGLRNGEPRTLWLRKQEDRCGHTVPLSTGSLRHNKPTAPKKLVS